MNEKRRKVKILSSGVTAKITIVTKTEFTYIASNFRES